MKTLYTLILVLLAGTAYGQSNLPNYELQFKRYCEQTFGRNSEVWNDCLEAQYGAEQYDDFILFMNGKKTNIVLPRRYRNGYQYVGEVFQNLRHGYGILYYGDTKVFEGQFKNNEKNGTGKLFDSKGLFVKTGIWQDGVILEDNFADNSKQANNTQNTQNNATPVVYGKSNLPACQGSDASRWSNCQGAFNYTNGDRYEGEFRDGKLSGQGTYYFLADNEFKGDKYVGELKDGSVYGQGTYTFANGDMYEGEYKDGVSNGQGTYKWANGDKYVGEWKDNQRTGRGIIYSAIGSIKDSGIYKDNVLVTSQYIDPNSFTRIARNSTAPVVSDAQRQENERKAAQLEEDRRRLEEEKRQIALERQRVDSQKNQAQIAPDNRRRFALVIGNDSYSSLPVLSNAVNDSKAMSEALKQANFEVSYYKNLSKRQMEEALNNFSKKLGKDDVGMFYFAGHGIQADSRNFLIPVSENVKKSSDVPFEGVDVDRVMASLRDSRNSLNIVVLDACRNSLDTRGGMSRGLTVTDAPQGSIVAYATSPGKTASDGDSGNSPFTKNLIRVMQRKGLKIEDVFKEVRVAVSRETNGEQVPQELSQLVSDFYFRQ